MSRIGKRYGTCASEIGEDPGRKDKTPLCRAAQPSQNAHLEARIDGDGNHIKGPLRVLMDTAEQTKKSSDSMGTKHRVNHGIYVTYGGINRQLVEKNRFTVEDAGKIKKAPVSLLENDASFARPDGGMEVLKVYWWKHTCAAGQYSSAKVHHPLHIEENDTGFTENLEGLVPEVIDGR